MSFNFKAAVTVCHDFGASKIMVSSISYSWQIDGEIGETVTDFIWGALKLLQMVTGAMKLKDAYSLEEKLSPI